jgi:hypothetical protein
MLKLTKMLLIIKLLKENKKILDNRYLNNKNSDKDNKVKYIKAMAPYRNGNKNVMPKIQEYQSLIEKDKP